MGMGAGAVRDTAGVPVYENAGRCRPRHWIHGVVPWVVAQRLCRTATRVKTPAYSARSVSIGLIREAYLAGM